MLRTYTHLENIPHAAGQWDVPGVRGAPKLAATLSADYDNALLFKVLATLVTDLDVGQVSDWEWTGPTSEFETWCNRLDAPDVARKVQKIQADRG